MHTLYRLTFQSGKCYIGQTVRKMKTRLTQHRHSAMHGSQLPVHCAWRKYGEPTCEIISEHEDHAALHLAEIAAIRDQNTLVPNGYNLHFGGTTSPALNPIVAAKIGDKSRGRKILDTHNMSAAVKKQWEDPEYREHVSSGLKASWTDEMREAARVRIQARWDKRKAEGWTMPESQKQKLRNKVVSEETRLKMSNSAKGKPKAKRSSEHCRKISENVKANWANQDNTQRIESIKAAWDEEARADMSEKIKASWKDPEIRSKRIAAIAAAKS